MRRIRTLFVCLFLAWGGTPSLSVSQAQAQTGLTRLEDKVSEVADIVRKVLYVVVGIGVLFVGFRFLQGDPNAWRYTMMFVLGATIIFSAGEVLEWLQS
jgi:type IV secretory pathway VirB2 component (pilin)